MAGVVQNPLLRWVLIGLGWLFVSIGFIGIFVLGIPTTGPILLAAFFFSKSSERFDSWLLNHRVFGPIVRDWRAGKGFSVRLKTVAVVAIVISFALTLTFAITTTVGRVLMVLLASGIITYILRLPTKPTVASVQEPMQPSESHS